MSFFQGDAGPDGTSGVPGPPGPPGPSEMVSYIFIVFESKRVTLLQLAFLGESDQDFAMEEIPTGATHCKKMQILKKR